LTPYLPVLGAFALASIGGTIAWLVGIPAPFLTGPALAVTLGALGGIRVAVPDPFKTLCFLGIGVTMGTGVTPETVATALEWPISIILLALCVVFIFATCAILLQWLHGQDRSTSILSASPGHLSYILGLSLHTKADITSLSLVQSFRVLVLTLIVPFALPLIGGPESAPSVNTVANMAIASVGLLMVAGFVLGKVFTRLNIPAAYLLAGLAVSSVGHLTELTVGAAPAWLALPAFAIMGTIIGTRFDNISMKVLKAALAASCTVTLVATLGAGAFGAVTALLLGLPLSHVLVAFAPGGLEAMAAVAVTLQANPAYVAAHHVFRILFLTALIPLVLRRYGGQKDS
jgi:hypothetical protein